MPRCPTLALICLLALPAAAATVDGPPAPLPVARGAAVAQEFLAPGLSRVTTAQGTLCVASAAIAIAQSDYRAADGAVVPFALVRRSVATSLQVFGGPPGAAPEFRLQLRYSPRPGSPIALHLDGGGTVDVTAALEPSTDSLHLTGAVAAQLAAALEGGQGVHVTAVSGDTGRTVTDLLPVPDFAALQACRDGLAPAVATAGVAAGAPAMPLGLSAASALVPPPAAPPQVAQMQAFVGLRVAAAPTPATRVDAARLATCAMTPTRLPVHEGRLRGTTGFVALEDRVLVAFDAAGRPAQVYVPGLYEAQLGATGQGIARVSRAADGNVPGEANLVKGCLGAAAMPVCATPDGPGGWRLGPCGVTPAADTPPAPPAPERLAGLLLPPGGGGGSSGGGGGGSGGGGGGGGGGTDPDPDPDPPPVPLPAAGFLMLAALGGLVLVRRRRGTGAG